MTLQDLGTVLATTNLPVAYLAFPADEAPAMPFIVYQETGSDNFGADNIVWFSGMRVQIDLLTKRKDRTTEELVETTLTGAGLFWERVPEFDQDEACYRITYEVEI